jgi:hypothetical protein
MRFKRMLLALTACLAVAAFVANAAQAAWTVGGATLGATEHKVVNVSGGPWTLSGKVGKVEIELKAEKVACATTEGCTIDGSSFGNNHSTGALTYSGVTVSKPTGCTSGSITTKPLFDEVIMGSNGAAFDKFFPQSGTTFVEITLGGTCAIAGIPIPVSGTATGEASLATGVASKTQTLTFGPEQQTHGGGSLTVSGNAASLVGTATNVLKGEAEFSAHE